MPRIQGVDIPPDKPTHVSLRYIRGLGPTTSLEVCEKLHIDPQRRAKELSDDVFDPVDARAVRLGLFGGSRGIVPWSDSGSCLRVRVEPRRRVPLRHDRACELHRTADQPRWDQNR